MSFLRILLLAVFAVPVFAQEPCIDPDLINDDAICLGVFDPVCGCDNVTYQNDCYAVNYGGVTSWTPGECSANTCFDLGDIDFGLCDMALGVALLYGQCMFISGCGYTVDSVDYSPYFFDSMENCAACQNNNDCFVADQVDLTHDCGDIIMPVCGCDGATYENPCSAYNHGGVTSWINGVCVEIDECTDVASVDFGACAMALGVVIFDGVCTFISGCDYVVDGIDYSPAFHESLLDCAACHGENCFEPEIINQDFGCYLDYDPVCGCDNVTYTNECVAYYFHGITNWTQGECEPTSVEAYADAIQMVFTGRELRLKNATPVTQISLYTLTGKMIIQNGPVAPGETAIDVSGLNTGIYLYHIQTNDGKVVSGKLLLY